MKINNFRDIINKSRNLPFKNDCIYRAGHPDNIAVNDLYKLGIRTIIDLRQGSEQRKVKTYNGINSIYLPIDYDKRIKKKIKPIIFKKNIEILLKQILLEEYCNLVESNKNVVKVIFELLGNKSSYPLLIHCRAGKDRTGFVAAIIQLALGINKSEVLFDYLLTNKYFLPKIKKFLMFPKIISLGMLKTRNIEYLLTAHEANMLEIINIVENDYESIENYLENCGTTKDDLFNLREIFKL